jgi:hypothetical protein
VPDTPVANVVQFEPNVHVPLELATELRSIVAAPVFNPAKASVGAAIVMETLDLLKPFV